MILKTVLGLLVFYFMLQSTFCKNSRIVKISQGLVRGYRDPEEGIFVFHNVPYAKAPSGPHRFKGPLPPPVWNGTFEAVNRQIVCPQGNLMGFLPHYKVKQEDCLIANIYVSDTKEKNLPVVAYIHGGGFVIGWADLFTFKKFVKNQKVIVVSINYRVSAHGFLCLGTKDAPGNAGMKDQIAALKWIKNNIRSFGGNPDDVTIHGCSAGSSAVDILILSKMAKGLFKGAMADSGSGLASYTVQIDPIENAKIYAKLLGYDGKDDIYSLESYYKSLPYETLNSVQVMNSRNLIHLMTPCVERDLGEEMFLDDSPVNILKKGNFNKIPMLYGFTDMEGTCRLPNYLDWKDEMNLNFSKYLPGDLHFKNQKEKETIAETVKQHYFGDKEIGYDTMFSFVDYFSDTMFIYPFIRSTKLHLEAGNNQIYLYEYSFFDNDTEHGLTTHVRGATHCAQTFAVMDGFYDLKTLPYDETMVSNKTLKMKSVMRNIWGSFVKTGQPIPEGSDLPYWRPMSCQWSEYMSINNTIQVKAPVSSERIRFWDQIYDKYYNNPHPPRLLEMDLTDISNDLDSITPRVIFKILCAVFIFKLLYIFISKIIYV